MYKKLGAILIALSMVCTPVHAVTKTINTHLGLKSSPSGDKIADGSFSTFDNLIIHNGNIQVVKGRDRLATSANADIVVNGVFYYENSDASVKKYIVRESDEVVSYSTTWTGRTSLVGSLTNEAADFVQVKDTLYMNSATDGLHKWTGTGSMTAISGVSAPSAVDFSATTGVGGLTPGLSAVVTLIDQSGPNSGYTYSGGTCTQITPQRGYTVANHQVAAAAVSGLSGTYFSKTADVDTTYKYKVTKYGSATGIESEPSSSDSAALDGNNTVDVVVTNPFEQYGLSSCTSVSTRYLDSEIVYSGEDTQTTGTLATAPSAPFDSYRVYRTVAGGSDYFLLGDQTTGAYTDGKPDSTLGQSLDTTIDTITPPSYKLIAEYKGSLFTAEGDSIAFSRVPVSVVADADSYWLGTDKLVMSSKKSITGLHTTANYLLVFAENSIMSISGFGNDSFRKNIIHTSVGAVNDRTIEADSNGDIIFFSGTEGVFKLRTFDQLTDDLTGAQVDQPRTSVVKISSPDLDEVFRGLDDEITLDPADYTSSHAYYDMDYNRYFLYIGSHCFIFDNLTSQWSYMPATRMIDSTWAKSPNALGKGLIIDNLGFAYHNWTGYENGIESGTVTGSATAGTSTTLTDSAATFNTTGDGLKGLWVYIDNDTPEFRQITSNTGTAITVSSAFTTTPAADDVYYIAYIRTSMYSKKYSMDVIPNLSTVYKLYLFFTPSSMSIKLNLFGFNNWEDDASRIYEADLNTTSRFVSPSMPLRGRWVQLAGEAFVYNTSNTINPPIDIVAYTFMGDVEEAL